MTLARLDRLNLNEALAVCCFKFAHDLPNSGQDSRHSQGQAVHSLPSFLVIPDVMHSGVPNGSRLPIVVELPTIVREKYAISTTARVWQKKPVLPFPPDVLHVIDLVLRQQVPEEPTN